MEKNKGVNNVISIPSGLKGNFFRKWVELLAPFHHLTKREQDILAAFIKARFELSHSISDESLLDKVVMSDDVKTKIKEECQVSDAFFQVIIGKLKKQGAIKDGKINPKLIPKKLADDDKSFLCLLYFDLNGGDD